MKPRPRAEAERWLAQARSDLAFAKVGRREGFYAQACFHCQQSAEMALKALHYLSGARLVIGHSLVELLASPADAHPALASLRGAAARLDQLYIPTRYPNGLPAESRPRSFRRSRRPRRSLRPPSSSSTPPL